MRLQNGFYEFYHGLIRIIYEYILYISHRFLFVRKGKCKQCGKCCRHVYLRDRGKVVASFNDCLNLVRSDARMSQFTARGKNEMGDLYFACSHIDRQNRCSIYEKRPSLCRVYPQTGMLIYGALPKEDCGFYFVSRITGKKVS
jgi:Fe-S-cluster containining protein